MITYGKDLLERVVATFLQAFLGVLAASNLFTAGSVSVSELRQLAGAGVAAGVAAVLAFGKGVAAKRVGESGTASLVPVPAPPADYNLADVEVVPATA